MSIAEAVEAALTPRRCKFSGILADLPTEDTQAILDGLNGALTNVDAARILTANGFPVNEKAIRVHRAGDCRCEDAS